MQSSSIYTFCLLLFRLFTTKIAFCRIVGPTNLEEFVGNNVTFMWNTTNGTEIRSAIWGLSDGQMPDPQFINVNALTGKPITSNLSKQYIGRVEFVGNLKQGKAWFMIKNLTIEDSMEYIARISEGDVPQPQSYPVGLEVKERPELVPKTTFITRTVTSTYNMSITSNASSQTPHTISSEAAFKTGHVWFTLFLVKTGQLIVK